MMNFFKRIRIGKKRKEKNVYVPKPTANRNQAAFDYLRAVGFSAPEVRGCLIALNKLNVAEIARNSDVTAPTIYAAAYGKRKNARGREILSQHLGLPVPYLFPEDGGNDGA